MKKALARRAALAFVVLAPFTGLAVAPAQAQDHVHAGASGLPHNIPNFCQAATVRSARSGPWSSAATWNPARVPGPGDVVMIDAGHDVAFDSTGNTACIGITGKLTLATTVNTQLRVGTLQVLPAGTLTIGTEADPVRPNVLAEIIIANQPLNTSVDPEQYGTGLVGLGTVRMFGAQKTPYVRLAQEPAVGQNKLVTAETPAGWNPGDVLALPDSKQWHTESVAYVPEWETTTLGSANGTTLNLSANLRYNHPGARNAADTLEFLPHVANLTRNVRIRSEDPNGTRGHVIFVNRADIDVRWVQLKDLGRTRITPLDSTTFDGSGNPTKIGTNQIGRYSMHFHHLMGPTASPASGRQYVFVGNTIDDATKWGIAIHQSHYGLIADNVVYHSLGAGVMTEDGNESYNIIERNFVLVTIGTGEERVDIRGSEYGFEGSAFWFHGPNNYVRNNIGASANSFGYTIAMVGNPTDRVPKFPGADLSVAGQYDVRDLKATPLLEFANNELYAAKSGLTVWDLGAQCCETIRPIATSTVKNLRLWHISRYGYYGYGQNKVEFDGWVQRGDKRALANSYEWFLGFFFSDYITRNLVIRNSDLQNLRTGIHVPPKSGDNRDIYGNAPGTTLIENTILRNVTNIKVSTPWGITGGGGALPPRQTIVNNVLFGNVPGNIGCDTAKNILMAYEGTSTNANQNFIQMDEVVVKSYNQVPTDNFKVFYSQQNPTFVVPQTVNGNIGAPVSGLTNQQAWQNYGIAVAGAVATCTTTRPDIVGYACPIVGTPPSPPRNLRITQ